MSRISIHRGKKLTAIAKKKDDIAKHLEAGNEVNAKIWAETLINDEGMIPCFDIISILCDQLNGRLKTIEKFGPPKDMDQNFRTLAYAAPRTEIDELQHVRRYLGKLLGKEFLLSADMDEQSVNKVVAANINIRIPEEGEKVKRLVEIAQERNIDYKPSAESLASLRDYCDRKGIENPLGGGASRVVLDNLMPPPYNPQADYQAMLPQMDAAVVNPPGYMMMTAFSAQQPQAAPYMPSYQPGPPQGGPPPSYNYYPQQIPPPPVAPNGNGYHYYDPAAAVNFGIPPAANPFVPPASESQNMGSGDGASDIDDFQAKLDALKKL